MARQRVYGRQVRRPEGLAEIPRIRQQSVANAKIQWHNSQARNRAAVLLDKPRDRAGSDGQREEGKLLNEQWEHCSERAACLVSRERQAAVGKLKPAQRPEVEQQQDEGQRDEHRFAHEAEGEEHEGESAPKCCVRGAACSMFPSCYQARVTCLRYDFGLWTLGFRLLDVSHIGQQRQQEEERAQNVLAFGSP